MRDRLGRAADKWELKVNSWSVRWKPVIIDELPQSTGRYFTTIIVPSGLGAEIADEVVEDTLLFRFNDPWLKYFHHDPITSSHQWAGEGFHDALDNNQVLAYLFAQTHPAINQAETKRILDLIDLVGDEFPNELAKKLGIPLEALTPLIRLMQANRNN